MRWRKPVRRSCMGAATGRILEGEMPDAGRLFELFQAGTPDKATRHRILVDNPARLYGFPN
jgi:predicted TIM-barrel fold metal-dependent hydrolase